MIWKRQFTCSVYGADVLLIVGDFDEYRAHVKRSWRNYDIPEREDGIIPLGRVSQVTSRKHVEWLLWFPTLEPSNETLMHECMHVAIQMLRVSGVRLTESSEEAFTYLAVAFFRDFRKALGDAKKREERNRRIKPRARRVQKNTRTARTAKG